MEVTVREAATLMGVSPRTVRARLERGDLPGTRRNGRWMIPKHALPLTEAQRFALQARADEVRRTVEAALPSRVAATSGSRSRSLADQDAFLAGHALLLAVRGFTGDTMEEEARHRLLGLLETALLDLAEGIHLFDRDAKGEAFARCRSGYGRAAALLLASGPIPPPEPRLGWLMALEQAVIPAVGRLARQAESFRGRRP